MNRIGLSLRVKVTPGIEVGIILSTMKMSIDTVVRVSSVLTCALVLGACGDASRVSPPSESPDQDRGSEQIQQATRAAIVSGEVPHGVWWKIDTNIEAMGLNAVQLEELERIDTRFFQESARLRKQERRSYARFISALRANQQGGEQIEESGKAFAGCRARHQELLIWRLTEIRQVLDLDQWGQLKTIAPAVMKIGQFLPFASSEPVRITDEWPPQKDQPGE